MYCFFLGGYFGSGRRGGEVGLVFSIIFVNIIYVKAMMSEPRA